MFDIYYMVLEFSENWPQVDNQVMVIERLFCSILGNIPREIVIKIIMFSTF